jgi:hypothetical protein
MTRQLLTSLRRSCGHRLGSVRVSKEWLAQE